MSLENEMTASSTRHPLSRVLPKKPEGPMRAPARVLGWFSIGLGLTELIMPRTLARLAGAPNLPVVTRMHGLREIGVGVGLLMSKDPTPWLWGRVAGDVVDLATVGPGVVTSGRPVRTLTSLAVLGGITYIDAATARAAAPKPRSHRFFDYSSRSGFPKPASEMRGAAVRAEAPPA